MLLRDSVDPDSLDSLTARRDFSAPRNDEFAGQVSQLSDTKASLLSHQARPSTVQHYRSTCFNMVATSWLRFATWKFWNNRNDRPVLHVAPTVLPLHLLPSPSLFPLSPRRQGLRTLRMLWIACLQFEMSGDVRRCQELWNRSYDMKRRWNHSLVKF